MWMYKWISNYFFITLLSSFIKNASRKFDIFSQNMGILSSFGSAIWELHSDYLISSNLKLRTFHSTFHENSELLNYQQNNTLD